jgi:hypothetical protein
MRDVGEFFKRTRHGLLVSESILCRETFLIYCRLIMKASHWSPRSVLKFAVNSSIETLPTFTNLRRWENRASVNCQLCGSMVKQTLFHVLVYCKHTLDQGRLTWRHDSVLNHIAGCLKSALVGKSTVELYCDLDRLQAPGGGSIPADIMLQA